MRLSLPPVVVTPETGFGSKADIFKRQPYGERLTNLIVNSDEDLVFALDSNWGQGKSTFVRMWADYNAALEEPLETIYFDAFENDYQKDSFLAIASEVYKVIADDDSSKSDFTEKAANVFRAFGRGLLKAGVKVSTAGIIDDTILDSVADDLSSTMADNVDSLLSDRFESSKQDKESLSEFKSFLERMILEKTHNRKLVFIIDELDRCRPDFALDILEKIKHLFNIPGLTFLLVMNRDQLEESVKCRYGSGIDAKRYLQKFINVWLSLPKQIDGHTKSSVLFAKHAINSMECRFFNEKGFCKDTFLNLIERHATSYREIERMLTYISIVENTSYNVLDYDRGYATAIVVTCFLKVNNPSLLKAILNKSIDGVQATEELRVSQNDDFRSLQLVAFYLSAILSDSDIAQQLQDSKLLPLGYGEDFNPMVFNEVDELLSSFTFSY